MSDWNDEVPTDGTVDLPPDPRALDALGRNHSLETALADLVDNSIDAAAADVLIRFVQRGPRLVRLYVVDNGTGIAPDAIDTAMTVGGRRDYGPNDLGRFGLGLKAASLSQASSLTVVSRAAGHGAIGRRLRVADGRREFGCDTVTAEFATADIGRSWSIPMEGCGTVVRWDDVRGFPAVGEREHTDEFLARTIAALRGHLGLMFHRILTAGTVRIRLDVEDLDAGTGLLDEVTALDPFGYASAPAGWPKDLVADVTAASLVLRCHIWPGRANVSQYRLPGGAEARQGLYFYRRDRLLHAGGWEGVHAPDRRLQLARVAVDIEGDVTGLFVMNPEKSRVSAGPDFARAVNVARAADGTTINDYLGAAEDTWVRTNQRTAARRPVVPPGRGLHAKVVREIREELPQLSDQPLNLQWRAFASDDFFEVDRVTNTLWLNQAYRRALLGGRRGGLNDLPIIKALLFLLTQEAFQGSHLGARDKDNLDLWQEILTAAAKADKSVFEARA